MFLRITNRPSLSLHRPFHCCALLLLSLPLESAYRQALQLNTNMERVMQQLICILHKHCIGISFSLLILCKHGQSYKTHTLTKMSHISCVRFMNITKFVHLIILHYLHKVDIFPELMSFKYLSSFMYPQN